MPTTSPCNKKEQRHLHDRVVISSHPSKDKNAVDGCEPIYILAAIDIKPLTEDDLKTEFEIMKLKYPLWRNKTFEDFCYWLSEIYGQNNYAMEIYDAAYFLNPVTAWQYAENNITDINECGSYPYLAIYTRPTNHMYAETYPSGVTLFQYNPKTDKYDEIKDTSEKIYQYMLAQFNSSHKRPQ